MKLFSALLVFALSFLMIPISTNAVDYEDIEIVDIPGRRKKPATRSGKNSTNIVINNNIVLSTPPRGGNSYCTTPGAPSTSLIFGKIIYFELQDDQSEYWFCLDNPYDRIEIHLYTGASLILGEQNREAGCRGRFLRLDLLDKNMERIGTQGTSSGWGGSNYTSEMFYVQLRKGKHYVRIDRNCIRNRKVGIVPIKATKPYTTDNRILPRFD